MLDTLDSIDKALFLVLNGCHSEWSDAVMWYVSKMQFWLPVYALLLFLLYRRYNPRLFFLAVFLVALMLFITDFMAVHLIKENVMRLRPSHDPEIASQVQLVRDGSGNFYKGGRYGFFSNHSSNYFGVATFFFLLMRPMKKWSVALLVLWVLLIVYSRIYLGVHYPGDVLAGAVYGMVAGSLMAFIFHRVARKLYVA